LKTDKSADLSIFTLAMRRCKSPSLMGNNFQSPDVVKASRPLQHVTMKSVTWVVKTEQALMTSYQLWDQSGIWR